MSIKERRIGITELIIDREVYIASSQTFNENKTVYYCQTLIML